jgi:hypothetical protein
MKSAEKILKEYINFEDVNQSETVEILPLTIVDAMEEYANQCQEDMADRKYTEEDIRNAIREGRNSVHFENDGSWWEDKTVEEDFINSLNKQDNEK